MQKSSKDWLGKIFRVFVYALPVVLFFSYYPLISFGSNESMNFELSLPLIWLVLFDGLAAVLMIKLKKMRQILTNWHWFLAPIYLTLTILWSQNQMRGMLTSGIVWLLGFAIYAFLALKNDMWSAENMQRFWQFFYGSALAVCGWCFLQCILDLCGIERTYSLMCAGCTYKMFGFPHPNGFAIEPQFMGNLLLAPIITASYQLTIKKVKRHGLWAVLLVYLVTLFLTFSRGAIYAAIVASVFLVVAKIVQTKRWEALKIWLVVGAAFVFTLNMQGVMTQISVTRDTYFDGVARAINHLSLGLIDLRGGKIEQTEQTEQIGQTDQMEGASAEVIGILGDEKEEDDVDSEAIFDGYVAESTDTRVRLTEAALAVWRKSPETIMFGVGIGGAGQALYQNGLSVASKEIVQNEYISVLLETGLVGVGLIILTMVWVIMKIAKEKDALLFYALMVSYGISLLFFSGLPNVLHIYLLPVVLITIGNQNVGAVRIVKCNDAKKLQSSR